MDGKQPLEYGILIGSKLISELAPKKVRAELRYATAATLGQLWMSLWVCTFSTAA